MGCKTDSGKPPMLMICKTNSGNHPYGIVIQKPVENHPYASSYEIDTFLLSLRTKKNNNDLRTILK